MKPDFIDSFHQCQVADWQHASPAVRSTDRSGQGKALRAAHKRPIARVAQLAAAPPNRAHRILQKHKDARTTHEAVR